MRIHHIGYLVKRLESAMAKFQQLGYTRVSEVTHDTIRLVDIVFMEKDGYRIELVSPYDAASVVSGMMKTYRNAPYHICYISSCFQDDLKRLQSEGFVLMDEPREAPAFGDRQVAFLLSAKIGMIEVLDKAREEATA